METRLLKNQLVKQIEGMTKVQTTEEFIASLKLKIAAKKQELQASEFWLMISSEDTQTENTDVIATENISEPVSVQPT